MCTPLAKLTIGLSAAVATGFYYLAAAPPVVAASDVCGRGNYSDACSDSSPSPNSASPTAPEPELQSPEPIVTPSPSPSPEPIVTPSPSPSPEPIVTPSPSPSPEPIVTPSLSPSPGPIVLPSPNFSSIYTSASAPRSTAIPEPGTVTALLLTGAGIFCSGRKRGRHAGQQR
ncbi:MAG: hypothetical protein ACRC62_16290 [Microcoleus sp.]